MESTSAGNSAKDNDTNTNNSIYECNICLDTAKDAVVSMCGHLFCWPCLHQWLETRPARKLCPVCKAGICKEKVIPLYGRDNTEQRDPRDKVPPRPQGQRFEPENNMPSFSLGDGGGFHFSFGIGAFPFILLASAVNIVDIRQNQGQSTILNRDDVILNRVFIVLVFSLFFWLMIA